MSRREQYQMVEELEVFKVEGRGRNILTIRAKYFPPTIPLDTVNSYLSDNIYPLLHRKGPFSVLYVHTHAQRSLNFPALRSFFHHIPPSLLNNLHSLFFLHPDLQSRLFLATLGRLFFPHRLYGKVKYVSRVDYLWEHIRRNEIELPQYVYDHDEDLEYRPTTDYGLESDHPRIYGAPSLNSPAPIYSMRCIS